MRRRHLTIIFVLLGLAASACGALGSEPLAFTDATADKTILRIATSRIEGFEGAIASWERDHPTVEIDVVVDSAESHREWLRTEASATTTIDIIAFDAEYGADARARPDLFIDLREHEAEQLEDDFLTSRWTEGIGSNGELIGLPVDVDAHVLLVRNDIVDPSTIRSLNAADSWCDVIQAGNDVFHATEKAFFADGEELLRAMLSQSRSSWVTTAGRLDETTSAELARAFDLALLAVGEDPLGTNPCPELTGAGAIARDLTPGESVWRAEIASDDFVAVISQWSTRNRISQSHPDSINSWLAIPLPTDSAAINAGTSSEGGLHFGIAANSEHRDIALDFLWTITNPVVQRNTFASGQGPLPAVSAPYDDGTVADASDGFFAGRPTVGAIWADAVEGRATAVAHSERNIVITAFVDALARVQAELETPEEAWSHGLENVVNVLEQG